MTPLFRLSELPSKTFCRASACALLLAGGFLLMASGIVSAGTEEEAGKKVAESQAKEPFPIHFSLSAGIEKEFIFRGVNILPEKDLDVLQALDTAVSNVLSLQLTPAQKAAFIQQNGGSIESFVKSTSPGTTIPTHLKVARESGIGLFDGALDYEHGNDRIVAGAFYALQDRRRVEPGFFGGQSFFTEYREFDAFATYSHSFGPLTLSLGGTYYHVEKNSTFDTAEMQFGASYTPPQFRYISLSFSYDYSGGFNYSPEYLDGHYLELRVTGNIPVYKRIISFNPYMLVSAGAGIVPRAFNTLSQPAFFSNKSYSTALQVAINNGLNSPNGQASAQQLQAAFNPNVLDRSFDLSNFQVGFRVPISIGRYVTLRGDANYSRPLGNLDTAPYSQKDVIWGGVTLNFSY